MSMWDTLKMVGGTFVLWALSAGIVRGIYNIHPYGNPTAITASTATFMDYIWSSMLLTSIMLLLATTVVFFLSLCSALAKHTILSGGETR